MRSWRRTWRLPAAVAAGAVFGLAGDVGTAWATSSPTTDCSGTQCTVTYTYDGGLQSWSVPAGVTSATFEVFGAQGGSVPGAGDPAGGLGGETQGTLAVVPGQLLFVFVGGTGVNANFTGTSGASSAPGGFNGGGAGGGPSGGYSGAGGGGASDVRVGGSALSDRVLVAGGGGGASSQGGYNGDGGSAGGENGAPGNGEASTDGAGGTQTSGGAGGGGGGATGTAGTLGDGGAGGGELSGGGGGGYYGGGGGGWDSANAVYGPGGGGSSYAAASVSDALLDVGNRSGSGEVVISYVDDDLSIAGANDVTATATGASGAAVDYSAPIALDPFLATLPTVNCDPASGSTFPVGTTTVNCSATDSDGATAAASFTVSVTAGGIAGATTVDTGEPWAGSAPLEIAMATLGVGLIALGARRRRQAQAAAAGGEA